MAATALPFDARLVMGAARTGDPPALGPAGELTEARLRQLVACMDLTTLAGDDKEARVLELCQRARESGVAAVCVYPAFVLVARRALAGSGIGVATVAAGFPHGLSPLSTRVAEVAACRELRADDIDVVIRREHALRDDWVALYEEVRALREAAGDRHLKVILATGELRNPVRAYRASLTAMLAGADFVKTSTGKESVNATLEATGAMLTAVREFRAYAERTVGLKPAGGIRTAEDALAYLHQAEAYVGPDYVAPATFRLGASSLLDDVQGRHGG